MLTEVKPIVFATGNSGRPQASKNSKPIRHSPPRDDRGEPTIHFSLTGFGMMHLCFAALSIASGHQSRFRDGEVKK
jgi:hypothetical protein